VLGLPALKIRSLYTTVFLPKAVNVWKVALLLVIEQCPFWNLEFLGNLLEENPFLFVFHFNLNPARDLRTAVIVKDFRNGEFLVLACERAENHLSRR
jgi:hypothetical protein